MAQVCYEKCMFRAVWHPIFFSFFGGGGEGGKNIEVKMTNYTIHVYHLFNSWFGASKREVRFSFCDIFLTQNAIDPILLMKQSKYN